MWLLSISTTAKASHTTLPNHIISKALSLIQHSSYATHLEGSASPSEFEAAKVYGQIEALYRRVAMADMLVVR